MTGTYILVIICDKKHKLTIGSLGNFFFKKGFYLYIGSAMGLKGSTTLLNRVKRHLLPSHEKNYHWHIDYFLGSKLTHIIQLYLIPSKYKLECIIAKEINLNCDSYVKNFGSSDCSCKSHFFYFSNFGDIRFKEVK